MRTPPEGRGFWFRNRGQQTTCGENRSFATQINMIKDADLIPRIIAMLIRAVCSGIMCI
jgi:hypothetical protein